MATTLEDTGESSSIGWLGMLWMATTILAIGRLCHGWCVSIQHHPHISSQKLRVQCVYVHPATRLQN